MVTLDEGMAPILGEAERDRPRVPHAAENGAQFKNDESFLKLAIYYSQSERPWVGNTNINKRD